MPNINQIKPQRANANRHTPRGMKTLEDSIQRDGWIGAITVAADHETFDGSARLEVGAATGFEDAIVVRSDGSKPVIHIREDIPSADDPRAKRLGIAANRVAQLNLEWSPEVIAELASEGDVLDGLFSDQELTDLLASLDTPEGAGGDDFDTTPQEGPTRVQYGELWQLGAHRLLCGDSTKQEDVGRLMGGEKASALITDPPYGMRLDADFSGMTSHLKFAKEHGGLRGRKYDNVTGDHEDFDASPVMQAFKDVTEQFWFGADYYSATLGDTMHTGAWLVWDKRLDDSADKMYGSCFELIWSKHKHKRDMLRHKWAGIFGNEQGARQHPNQKPVSLIEDMIARYTKADAIIADVYAGSGTTLIAAERTHRRCYGMEIEPKYCDVILRRWEAETGREAVRVDG